MAVVETGLPRTVRVMAEGSISISPTFKGLGGSGSLETAQHSFNASDEFSRTERLGNVVVGAEFETEHAVGFAALGGQENHRDGREAGSLADGATNFEAVFARAP